MKKLALFISIMLFSGMINAQDLETNQSNKSEILKLAFIVGDWKGEGWMMRQDGQKHTFTQTESIRFKIDSTAILIEGVGFNNGNVIHNALAVITYNKAENSYSFQSYLANGRQGKFKAELIEGKLYWYPMEHMRYIISINEKGQWHETGEMKRQEKWFEFFQMVLDKQ